MAYLTSFGSKIRYVWQFSVKISWQPWAQCLRPPGRRLVFDLCGRCVMSRYEFVYVVDIIVQSECFVAEANRRISFVGSYQRPACCGYWAFGAEEWRRCVHSGVAVVIVNNDARAESATVLLLR